MNEPGNGTSHLEQPGDFSQSLITNPLLVDDDLIAAISELPVPTLTMADLYQIPGCDVSICATFRIKLMNI